MKTSMAYLEQGAVFYANSNLYMIVLFRRLWKPFNEPRKKILMQRSPRLLLPGQMKKAQHKGRCHGRIFAFLVTCVFLFLCFLAHFIDSPSTVDVL